ncbi:polymer-forming cytoskeletal protein [Candidatus Gracilibacteria bacterium]|nr:polymer-forming cytoskeletal protein [Candidatus Gracilibacteria bacterium]
MKKILIVFLSTILFHSSVGAFQAKAEENLNFTEKALEDTYLAGGRVRIEAPVEGDLASIGGEIIVKEHVSEDVLLLGGRIQFLGSVKDDFRAGGGEIILEGEVGDDVLIGAGKVEIRKTSIIKGDLAIGSGEVLLGGTVSGKTNIAAGIITLSGIIEGDASLLAEEINVEEGAEIKGNLFYSAPQPLPELEALVTGEVTHEIWEEIKEEHRSAIFLFGLSFALSNFLYLLVFGGLLFFALEKFWQQTGDELRSHPWISLLRGFLYLVAMPFVIVILLISVLGIPIAFLSLFVYIFSFVLFELLGTVIFTGLFVSKYLKNSKSIWKKLGLLALVSLVFAVVSGLDFIIALFAIGALITTKFKLLKTLK